MKIDRRTFLLASSAASLALRKPSFAFGKPRGEAQSQTAGSFSAAGKQVKVYTTADKTDHRISLTDTISFKSVGQPRKLRSVFLSIPPDSFKHSSASVAR